MKRVSEEAFLDRRCRLAAMRAERRETCRARIPSGRTEDDGLEPREARKARKALLDALTSITPDEATQVQVAYREDASIRGGKSLLTAIEAQLDATGDVVFDVVLETGMTLRHRIRSGKTLTVQTFSLGTTLDQRPSGELSRTFFDLDAFALQHAPECPDGTCSSEASSKEVTSLLLQGTFAGIGRGAVFSPTPLRPGDESVLIRVALSAQRADCLYWLVATSMCVSSLSPALVAPETRIAAVALWA